MPVTLLDWSIPISIFLCGLGFLIGNYVGFQTALWGLSLTSLGIGYTMMLFQTDMFTPIKQVVEDSFVLFSVILGSRALDQRKSVDAFLPLEIAAAISQATLVLASLLLFKSVRLETFFVQICCTIILWRSILRYVPLIQSKADKLIGAAFLFIAIAMSLLSILYLNAPDINNGIGTWRSSVWGNLVQYTGLLGAISLTITVMLATGSDSIEKYRKYANTDCLTNLLNRRGLHALLSTTQGHRFKSPATAIILADIDHFKGINDRFGHPFGDQVITGFGALLQEQVGARGRVARIGGEEFAVLLPGTNLDEIADVAEKMRLSFEKQRWPQTATDCRFSASFGVTLIRDDEEFSASIERADSLLYLAKRKGRNNVVTSLGTETKRAAS